jgi:hypothetical protein
MFIVGNMEWEEQSHLLFLQYLSSHFCFLPLIFVLMICLLHYTSILTCSCKLARLYFIANIEQSFDNWSAILKEGRHDDTVMLFWAILGIDFKFYIELMSTSSFIKFLQVKTVLESCISFTPVILFIIIIIIFLCMMSLHKIWHSMLWKMSILSLSYIHKI